MNPLSHEKLNGKFKRRLTLVSRSISPLLSDMRLAPRAFSHSEPTSIPSLSFSPVLWPEAPVKPNTWAKYEIGIVGHNSEI